MRLRIAHIVYTLHLFKVVCWTKINLHIEKYNADLTISFKFKYSSKSIYMFLLSISSFTDSFCINFLPSLKPEDTKHFVNNCKNIHFSSFFVQVKQFKIQAHMLKSKNYNSCTYIEQINSKVRGCFFMGLNCCIYEYKYVFIYHQTLHPCKSMETVTIFSSA